jgi:hypothetical protein
MKNCFQVYLDTTNPQASYSSLFSFDVLFSILFHSIAYYLIINGILLLFKQKPFAFHKLFWILIVIMVFGYIGRLYRAKTIFHDFQNMGYNSVQSREKTCDFMRTGYFTYYFLA